MVFSFITFHCGPVGCADSKAEDHNWIRGEGEVCEGERVRKKMDTV